MTWSIYTQGTRIGLGVYRTQVQEYDLEYIHPGYKDRTWSIYTQSIRIGLGVYRTQGTRIEIGVYRTQGTRIGLGVYTSVKSTQPVLCTKRSLAR